MAAHQVFLSHAGEDHALSISLADQLRTHCADLGHAVDVFNTSEPEYRFRELEERIRVGEPGDEAIVKWEEDLRDYLRTNIESSRAYVLLVTPKSLAKNSRWISFEMQVAREIAVRLQAAREFAGRLTLYFFPCTVGASLHELPGEAIYFQGVELDKPNGFFRLTEGLNRVILHPGERHA
jgi:hypothetical protein